MFDQIDVITLFIDSFEICSRTCYSYTQTKFTANPYTFLSPLQIVRRKALSYVK